MLEYTVEAEQVVANVSTARTKRAQIFFDSSPGQSEHLLNPAELLLSAFSVCMLKNVERLAPLLRFSYTRTAIRVHGVREDKPPRLVRINWELTIWTDEPASRVDLLEHNLRKQGTIYNTLAVACEVEGRVIALVTGAQMSESALAAEGDL